MAKRIVKTDRIKQIIKNIADDFRFSQEMDEYALLFYAVDESQALHGAQIESMKEYVSTGLKELSSNISWRQEFLSENAAIDEMKMLENLQTIEKEYIDLLAFLK